jgi:hypothetical protein
MAHTEAEPAATTTPAEPPVHPHASRRVTALQVAAAGAGAAALLWAVVAVICASRGLDPTDESFYLLTYRWWNVNFDNFTGAQYVYGPVFQLLHHDIAGLRIFKVITLLAAHALFGWTFMSWLRLHRPDAPPTRWWEGAGTAAIVACAGAVYSWLPLSPGYNDLALLCTVLGAATALRVATAFVTGVRPPLWASIGSGVVAVVMVLDKWSAALFTLAVLAGAVVVVAVTAKAGWRRVLQTCALALAGAVATVGVIDLLLVPLAKLVPPLVEVNRLVAASSNSPAQLLPLYWNSAKLLAEDIGRQQGLLLLAAVVVPFLRRPSAARLVTAAALGVGAAQVVRHHGLYASSVNLPSFTVTLFTPLVAVLLAGSAHAVARRVRSDGRPTSRSAAIGRWTVLLVLTALPITQAAGTGNPIHFVALPGLGIWMAVAIAILTSVDRSALGTRTLVAGALAGLVLGTSLIAVDGLWNRPYRTTGHDQSTAVATDVPAFASLRLDPETARRYAGLRALLKPYVVPPGRAMMAFDGLAGVVLALDGRPVGEAWYPGGAYSSRAAAGIHRACEGGHPWWGDRKPVVIFNRRVTPVERRVLRFCGLSLKNDYRVVQAPGIRGVDLTIHVPVDEPGR